MDIVTTEYLAKELVFSEHRKFNVKCEIYCMNHDIDLEQYLTTERRSGIKRIYSLPLTLAIGIVENVRMSNPNRTRVLNDLYAKHGTIVITQHHARKEIELLDTLKDTLKELGHDLLTQYAILQHKYVLDGYLPSHNLVIEFDEFHHDQYKDKDEDRTNEVCKHLSCDLIRLKEEDTLGTNIGKVISAMSL